MTMYFGPTSTLLTMNIRFSGSSRSALRADLGDVKKVRISSNSFLRNQAVVVPHDFLCALDEIR